MASLLLGAFQMIATDGTSRVQADGTSWGAPVSIEVAVNTFLQDGAIVVTQGHDNREVNVRVRFFGTDLPTLNAKEAALFLELEKPNTLTWTPDNGPATVFDVITSSLGNEDESFVGEVQPKPWRTYNVRLLCAAFTRSATETTTASLAAGGSTTTLLDACSAATGWTGFVDGGAVSPASGGAQVTLTASVAKGSHTYALQKTFAATTTSTKYLIARWKPPVGKRFSTLTAIGDGVSLPLIAELPSSVSGYVNSYFNVAASSLAVTRFEWTGFADEAGSAVLTLDQVDVSDIKPIIGTGRQQQRTLLVGGSARTPATLVLESATAALGDAIVYVYDADETTIGYSPSMRQFRASGQTVTSVGTNVSGSSEPLFGGVNFSVPVGLFPQGSYHLLGRMASVGGSATPTISVTTKTTLGGNPIGSSLTTVTAALTTTYANFALAKFNLPTVDLPFGSPATMDMTISASPSTNTPTYDEFWLFNVDLGRYIRVNCGTGAGTVGGSARRLFIKPESVAVPRKRILMGHSADGSDAFFPAGLVTGWDFPQFKPPKVNVLAITPGATDATLTMVNFNRWHTNPAS